MMRRLLFAFAALSILAMPAAAQQQGPDLTFAFANTSPAFAVDTGPKIVISAANSRFVKQGSLKPFEKLAQTDGFIITENDDLNAALAANTTVLVIANPFLESYAQFPAMTPPSAFSIEEIESIRKWVENGGSLLLLADHAPLGGGSSDLAMAFGFQYLNGHTANEAAAQANDRRVNIAFTPDNGLSTGHPIVAGATGRKPVARFQAFGGQSFIPPVGAKPVLTIPQGWSAIFTYRLAAELTTAPRIDASGMSQGATLEYGKGRIAVFAEAGGFSAQLLDGDTPFGFNTPEAAENPEFVLATLRWLARFGE
jgi:hypothetical protein